MKITGKYIVPHNLFKIYVVTTCELYFCYKIILMFFYKAQISIYEKIILKFFVLSIVLARPCIILPVVGEINRIKNA